MRSHLHESCSHLDSPLQRLPAAAKIAFTIAVIFVLVLAPPSPVLFIAVAALLILLLAVSKIPVTFVAQRVLLLEPFVLGVALLALFQPHGPRLFAIVVARTTLCILAIVLMSNTTPFADMLRVLRRAHVPTLVVTTVALMHRYVFVLWDETARMRSARAARTFTRSRRHAWRGTAGVIAQLFVRSVDRADRIYDAMCARGWR